MIEILLILFLTIRPKVNFGSPFQIGLKTKGRNCSITSVNALGIVLCYPKNSGHKMSLCQILGIVPSPLQGWIDYGGKVFLTVLKPKPNENFNLNWPN